MNGALADESDAKSWTNSHGNVTQKIHKLFNLHNPKEPESSAGLRATTAMIQGLMRDAIAQDIRVLALGSGWSLSRAPTTDGWMLNTKPLNWAFQMSPHHLAPERADQAANLFLVQCGNSISELNKMLEVDMKRSLRTSGASNGQTITGAVSTGTHGSAIDYGAIQDHVVGLHLIIGPERHIWLERASNPVASQALIDMLDAEPVRDDALFDAAIVSFGGFGVIHALMIEVTERFLLEAHEERMAFNGGLKQAINSLDFDGIDLPDPSSRPYFFEMVLNPHARPDSKRAYITTMYKRSFPASHEIDYAISGGLKPGYDLLVTLSKLIDVVPDLTQPLANKIIEEMLEPSDKPQFGTLGETFDFSTPRIGTAGAAVGVPLARTEEVLRLMERVMEDTGPAPVAFGCRFVQRSQGTLSFTRFNPTCVIDIDGALAKSTERFLEAAWRALRESGIPHTQHWGKINDLNAESVRSIYGDDIDRWLTARRTLLPDAAHRRLFSGPFLERLELL